MVNSFGEKSTHPWQRFVTFFGLGLGAMILLIGWFHEAEKKVDARSNHDPGGRSIRIIAIML